MDGYRKINFLLQACANQIYHFVCTLKGTTHTTVVSDAFVDWKSTQPNVPVPSQNMDFHRNGCYVQWLEVRELFVLFSLEKLLTVTNSYFFFMIPRGRGRRINSLSHDLNANVYGLDGFTIPSIYFNKELPIVTNQGGGVAVGVMGVSYGSWIYHYPYNQYKQSKLWVEILLMARCTRYNIMWYRLAETFGRSVLFSCTDQFPSTIKLTATI